MNDPRDGVHGVVQGSTGKQIRLTDLATCAG